MQWDRIAKCLNSNHSKHALIFAPASVALELLVNLGQYLSTKVAKHIFVQLGFSMKLTHLSPVQY